MSPSVADKITKPDQLSPTRNGGRADPHPRAAAPLVAFTHCSLTAREPDCAEVVIAQRVDPSHPCLAAHFPGFTVYPGVFLLETVVQGVLAAAGAHGAAGVQGVHSMRFFVPLVAGDALTVHASVRPSEADGAPERSGGSEANRARNANRSGDANAGREPDRSHYVDAVCRRGDGREAARIKLIMRGLPPLEAWPEPCNAWPEPSKPWPEPSKPWPEPSDA